MEPFDHPKRSPTMRCGSPRRKASLTEAADGLRHTGQSMAVAAYWRAIATNSEASGSVCQDRFGQRSRHSASHDLLQTIASSSPSESGIKTSHDVTSHSDRREQSEHSTTGRTVSCEATVTSMC